MIKKLTAILLILITLFGVGSNCFAVEISSAYIVKIGEADNHLKYNFGDHIGYVTCSIVGHYGTNEYGETKFYPAYCLNVDKLGAESRKLYCRH